MLITGDARVKLSDFGLAREVFTDQTFHETNTKGTFGYFPYEVSEGKHHATSDVFGLGCVFYELLTQGKHPFGSNFFDKLANIRDGKQILTHLRPENALVGERWFEALDLIRWMTMKEPRARPSAEDVMNNIFFKNEQERFNLINLASKMILKNDPAFSLRIK